MIHEGDPCLAIARMSTGPRAVGPKRLDSSPVAQQRTQTIPERKKGGRLYLGARPFCIVLKPLSTLIRQVIVRPVKGNGPVLYWAHEELVAAAGAKLCRLLLVKGERKGQSVRFLHADAYETFHLADFVYEIVGK